MDIFCLLLRADRSTRSRRLRTLARANGLKLALVKPSAGGPSSTMVLWHHGTNECQTSEMWAPS